MNLYPAMRGHMGRWDYFTVKMTMRELAESVKFASDIYEDQTLDEAIQRALNEGRVKRDLVTYLKLQQDRFFSSIVVAALGGTPKWYPVTLENDERFALFRGDNRLNSAFGVLSFDGTQNYYALDGQHRLAAIKALVDKNSDASIDAPPNFSKEEVSVIVVVPREAESHQEFLERYRRLFGNLNRYAKPMDQVTNIIMDEDDTFAICTRRLITEHAFFKAPGKHKSSRKIKCEKGKNLNRQDSYFTSLETLYEMNITLLNTKVRKNSGWDGVGQKLKDFQRFRPEDQFLDELYDELALYWDSLVDVLPVLTSDPTLMRNHDVEEDPEEQDNALFWPIGQEIMATLARTLLDFNQTDDEVRHPSRSSVQRALEGLETLNWNLHAAPWRHVVLVSDLEGRWRIRNEERKEASRVVQRVLQWQLGLDELDDEGVDELRTDWQNLLLPSQPSIRVDEMWEQIEGLILA
jgi:DNA sulfur modification protein DndB